MAYFGVVTLLNRYELRDLGEIGETCPHQCPGECTLIPTLWLKVQDPELGIPRMRCVQAERPLTP